MKKYIMFPHAGSGNHGCEAIVRTTTQVLLKNAVTLFSDNIEEDKKYNVEEIVEVKSSQNPIRRFSKDYWKALFKREFLKRTDAFDALYYMPIIEQCDTNTVLLSIGGDNYCYGENEYIYMVNRYARKRGAKTILWGCSVEPKAISDKMKMDLEKYDRIVARESLSYNALKKINQKTVLYPDPAFTLKAEKAVWPSGLGNRPYIGINLSPLVCKSEKIDGITMQNYECLIERILEETNYDLAFIPHVVKKDSNDREILKDLYTRYQKTGRVYLVEDQSCTQLKEIISKCHIFIGARTHATIAAYSTCVPTLVLGYSIKARGIAKDLFGTEEHYVLPVQALEKKEDLMKSYLWIEKNRESIKKHLGTIMPEYIQRAKQAAKILTEEEI